MTQEGGHIADEIHGSPQSASARTLWDQQPTETSRQFATFREYRDMHPVERSLAEVGRKLIYTTVYNRVMTATELRRLRHRLRLSQTQLAAIVGVPSNTIARWERGEMEMRPAMDRLVQLTVGTYRTQQRRKKKRRT